MVTEDKTEKPKPRKGDLILNSPQNKTLLYHLNHHKTTTEIPTF